jgi:tetratricopeptide (TPR) repeat protein
LPIATDQRPCPSEREWDELAAGLIRDGKALAMLDHAAGCDRCAELLRASIDIFQPGGEAAPSAIPRRPRRWIPFAIAAMIVAGLVGLNVLYFQAKNDPLQQLAIAYTKARPMEPRIPGAAFGALEVTRGRGTGDRPAELTRIAAKIPEELERNPASPIWLHAKGRLALLESRPEDAEKALIESQKAGGQSSDLWIDLATASYELGIKNRDKGQFQTALDRLGRALEAQPENPAAWFNRALVLKELGQREAAADSLEKLLRIEPHGPWSEESRRRLAELRQTQ